MNAYIVDIESQKLYPNVGKTWTIRIKQVGVDRWFRANPFKEENIKQRLLDFLFQEDCPMIIAHNGLGFDFWLLWKEFDIDFQVGPDLLCGRPVKFFDSLYASQFLLPDREGKHSLKSWGVRRGVEKIDYRAVAIEKGVIPKNADKGDEFSEWLPEMDEYCEGDCETTEPTFLELYSQIEQQGAFTQFYNGQKGFWLMQAQAFTGFKFDLEYALKLRPVIEKMIQDLRDEVEPELPPRGLKKAEENDYAFPANAYKKDGSFSHHMQKFIEKHNVVPFDDGRFLIYGDFYELTPGVRQVIDMSKPISLDDQKQLKDYFIQQGWIPTLFNIKKDSNNRKMRDENGELIQTSPKIQENQQICPNLLELEGDTAKKIVKFLSLRNRLGVLKGWMSDFRLAYDGRISSGASGIASTHRMKHTKVVNVPKADPTVLLGSEFRSLWTIESGRKLVACDAAALENRCEAHWTYIYDDGKTADEILQGDPHSKNAKAFYPDETKDFDIESLDFNKDDSKFKPYRSLSKNGKYCITYGGSPKKLAATLRKKEEFSQMLYDSFWKVNDSLKRLKDDLEKFWITQGKKKWIKGIDGRRLYSRSKHSLINLLFQSTGAICMDYALLIMHNKLAPLKIDDYGRPYYTYKDYFVARVGYFHDEMEFECDEEIAEEISKMQEWSIEEAGRILGLKIPLAGEAKIGNNWKEVH